MYANCCGLFLIVVFFELSVTAALHALILFIFYLLISCLGYPGLVVFLQKNFSSSKTSSRNPTPAASSRRGETNTQC